MAPDTTAMNPQFLVQIPRGTGIKCHVVVAVTQQYAQSSQPSYNYSFNMKKGSSSKNAFYPIGFAIYEARPNVNRLSTPFVLENVGRLDRIRIFSPSYHNFSNSRSL